MIWFFLAGMVAGSVGTVMYAHYWMRKHATVMKMTEEEMKKMEDKTHD